MTKRVWILLNLYFFLLLSFQASAWAGHILQKSGEVSPGERIRQQFLVDPASQLRIKASGIIGISSRFINEAKAKINMELINPEGGHINLASLPVDSSIRIEEYAVKVGTLRTLVIDNPSSGRWSLELSLDKQGERVKYHIDISSQNSLYQMRVPPVKLVKSGEQVSLHISILKQGQPKRGALVSAKISTFGKRDKSEINLFDNGAKGDLLAGDGIYSAILDFDKPAEYNIEVNATDEETFQRIGWTKVHVSRKGARLTGKINESVVDNDNNGKQEALNIIVEVEVFDVKSNYSLTGRLYDSSGKNIGLEPTLKNVQVMMPNIYANIPRSQGVHKIVVSFPGEWFLKTKGDGPYSASIDLEDSNLPGWPIESLKKPYQTKFYPWKDFESKQ